MDVITHIETFTIVVNTGSFSSAARELGVVPSVVAKRIAQLETKVSTRLFDRTTRKVSLTEAGEKFHARAMSLVTDFEDLLEAVQRDDGKPEGHLRIMAPTTLTMMKLGPVLCDFLAAHPRVTMELVLVDRTANPAETGFDLAISGRSASYEGVMDVPLFPVNPVLCASPELLARFPELTHPRELTNIPCLAFSATGTTWTFESSRGALSIDVMPRLLADDNITLLHAAIGGLGVALLPIYVAGDALRDGTLTEVLPRFRPLPNWFKAYIPRRRAGAARVKALLAFIQNHWPAEAR